jgi:type 1 fimbriae regulatory protein FimE
MSDEVSKNVKGKPPSRPKGEPFNETVRPRGEYLSRDEVERLCRAAGRIGRHGHRDATMMWVAFVHGFRATELLTLQVEQYDFNQGILNVRRIKNGSPATHPIKRREVTAIKKLLDGRRTGPVFVTERGARMQRNAFYKIVARAGQTMTVEGEKEPGLTFRVHPHMFRHACGFDLVKQGVDIRIIQAWLGHKNINHTVHYASLSPDAFKGINFE